MIHAGKRLCRPTGILEMNRCVLESYVVLIIRVTNTYRIYRKLASVAAVGSCCSVGSKEFVYYPHCSMLAANDNRCTVKRVL